MALFLSFGLGCGAEPSTGASLFQNGDGAQQQADGQDVLDPSDGLAPSDTLSGDALDTSDSGVAPDSETDVPLDVGADLGTEADVPPETAEDDVLGAGDSADSLEVDSTDAGNGESDVISGQSDVALAETDVQVPDAEAVDAQQGSDTAATTDAVVGTDAVPAATDAAAGTDVLEASDASLVEDAGWTDATSDDDILPTDAAVAEEEVGQGSDTASDPCLSMSCDDENSCTADSCSEGVCEHEQLPGCKQSCSTSAECGAGKCHTGLSYCVECLKSTDCAGAQRCLNYECVPAIGCSTDSACKPTGQVCDTSAYFCVDCVGNADCTNGLVCKQNKCEAATLCTSSLQCPGSELCASAKGYCVECLASVDCAPEEYCGSDNKCKADVCSVGHCSGGSYAACGSSGEYYGKPKSCSDGNSCTVDLCDPASGCSSVPAPLPCNDSNACTLVDVCVAGSCVGGEEVICTATNSCKVAPTCDPLFGVCGKETSKPDGTTCNEGGVCVVKATCTAGACNTQESLDCSDIDPASLDSCDPIEGCKHTWPDVCNGVDDDLDGQTDNATCAGLPCTCGPTGTVCKPGCTACPDAGDLALSINDNGQQKVVCAHDYPAWGMPPDGTAHLVKNSDGTTSDTATGLQWPQTLEDKGRTWSQAYTYCDNLALGGHTDWRMPTLFELHSIVDFQLSSKWDTSFFPALSGEVWTATPFLAVYGAKKSQWSFDEGGSVGGTDPAVTTLKAICVRVQVEKAAVQPRWTVVDDIVRTDEATNLMWAPKASVVKSQASAKQHCENLVAAGFDDWRLPTAREATTTLDPKSSKRPVKTPVLSMLAVGFQEFPSYSITNVYEAIWTATAYVKATKSEFLGLTFGDDGSSSSSYSSTGVALTFFVPTADYLGVACVRAAK